LRTNLRNKVLSGDLGRGLLVFRITSALSGKLQGLSKLLSLVEMGDSTLNRGLAVFSKSLARDINDKSGMASPVVVSPAMRCNLNCTGCYSRLYTKDGELSAGSFPTTRRATSSVPA
jgi:hypothetical protein